MNVYNNKSMAELAQGIDPKQVVEQTKKRCEQLKTANEHLRTHVANVTTKNAQLSDRLRDQIANFSKESRTSLNQLNQHVLNDSAETNKVLHELTVKYERVLQRQIELLTENQRLVQNKEMEEAEFNRKVDLVSAGYEQKISRFQIQVKGNMKKITDVQGVGLIKMLMKTNRFRDEIERLGGNCEAILAHTQIEEVVKHIKQRDEEIAVLEESNMKIDTEVAKMNEMMNTFKKLLENMALEKENLLKQNLLLLEKLNKSREIITKFLPQE